MDDREHITGNDARSGSTPHIVRYVLGISLVLTILALSAIWITGAVNAPENASGSATISKGEAD